MLTEEDLRILIDQIRAFEDPSKLSASLGAASTGHTHNPAILPDIIRKGDLFQSANINNQYYDDTDSSVTSEESEVV